MMDSQPPLTSPDGSSNRNTPERCPRPLYSRDSTQKDDKTLRCYQYKKIKQVQTGVQDEEEPCVWIDEPNEEEEIRTGPRETRNKQRAIKVEEEEGDLKIIEEKIPPEIGTGPGHAHRDVKAQQKKKKQVMTEKKILEIGIDGRYRWYNMGKHPIKSADSEVVDNSIAGFVAGENVTTSLQWMSENSEKSFSCMECGKRFAHESYLIMHHRSHTGEKPFGCPECGKRFMYKWSLTQHLASHAAGTAFLCTVCGEHFRTERILAEHRRLHSNKGIQR